MAGALPPSLAVDLFNRHLREIEKETEKELSKELRRVGNEVRDTVRGSSEDPFDTGDTRGSVKTSVRRKFLVSLYSNEPQAPVWNWGGTIKPRGVPIKIPRTEFVTGAVIAVADDVEERIAEAFDAVAAHNGFL